MTKVRGPWCVVSVLCLFTGCASTPPGDLPNLGTVDDHLYRGAQPLPGGYAELSKMGVGTIVDLRGLKASEPTREDETAMAKAADIRDIAVHMSGIRAPRREAVERVLAEIKSSQEPVFIHCRRGADRTGTVVAIYRITHDCWTADEAIQEARRRGMSWIEFGMRRFIRDWYDEVETEGCTPGG